MIINNFQSIQIMQNPGLSLDKGDCGVEAGKRPSCAQVSGPAVSPGASTQGILAGINYIEEQLRSLLTSYPPFFPLGTYQRADLIKGIRSIEDQIGRTHGDENLKKIISRKKLPENASDAEISASLDRLNAVRNQLNRTNPNPAKPGSILNVSV
jgi:hypothetical protein